MIETPWSIVEENGSDDETCTNKPDIADRHFVQGAIVVKSIKIEFIQPKCTVKYEWATG